jgi:hypothetical protein
MKDWTVLSEASDPFRLDRPADHCSKASRSQRPMMA